MEKNPQNEAASRSLDNVRVVLVGPLYGGNLGATCRAMLNCGISNLYVVNRHPELDMEKARRRALSATYLLDECTQTETLAEAVKDCSVIAGTTARMGLYRCHAKSPREWAPRLLEAAQNNQVAIVFGPEDKGLANEDLALCTHIIQIPSSELYVSLNLSHAVMVICHELFILSGQFNNAAYEWTPEAPSELRERMFEMWEKTLLRIGFMEHQKATHIMFGLRRILSRGKLTVSDIKILMGIARQAHWAADAHPEKPPEEKNPST